jgi:hypothetical protein
MIDVIMRMGNEVIIVRIRGHDVSFGANTRSNPMMAPIDGLALSHEGVIREFPELKGEPNWRIEAIAKFKEKIHSLDSEDKIYHYVVDDLKKFGWIPVYKQRQGFRMEVLRAN